MFFFWGGYLGLWLVSWFPKSTFSITSGQQTRDDTRLSRLFRSSASQSVAVSTFSFACLVLTGLPSSFWHPGWWWWPHYHCRILQRAHAIEGPSKGTGHPHASSWEFKGSSKMPRYLSSSDFGLQGSPNCVQMSFVKQDWPWNEPSSLLFMLAKPQKSK